MNNPIDNFPSAKEEILHARKYYDLVSDSSFTVITFYHLALAFLNLFAELVSIIRDAVPYLGSTMRK
jgi:hypothetical protein